MDQNTPPSDEQKIVEDAWRDQAHWSEVANQRKAELTRWRTRAAVAGVAGAFLQTLAAALTGVEGQWRWLQVGAALVGAVALGFVPFVMAKKASKNQVREWVRARSAAEALKETVYRYLLGASPFESTRAPADLVERCQTIKEKVRDLNRYTAAIAPLPKQRPLTLTIDDYVEKRVTDQIERYYLPKSG